MAGTYIQLQSAARGARRSRSSLRRVPLLPEAAVVVACILLLSGVARFIHWPVFPAILIGIAVAVASTAIMIARLALRAEADAREAETATARMRRLYELTRRTLEMDLHEEPGPRLAAVVREVFELDAVAVFDADLHEVYEAGEWATNPREMAQNVFHFETSDDDRTTGISRRVVRLASVPIGSLVVRGDTTPLTNSAIAALIAVTFDRYRATANESRIESEREAEQMRATVLDSLAHDYKTPLTAIRAASGGLAEMGTLTPAQADMVALIDEQATLLSELTTRLLTTARLETEHADDNSDGFRIHAASENVASIVEDVVAGLANRAAGMNIVVDLPDEDLLLRCDRKLISMLLSQYLDNACKYSHFDTTITFCAALTGGEALFSVHSFGPVIPMADRERIFDRYFRSSGSATHASGTGIGLSIAKRAAQAHGGSVWVSSNESEGTTFFAAIPAGDASISNLSISNLEPDEAPDITLDSLSHTLAAAAQVSAVERNLP